MDDKFSIRDDDGIREESSTSRVPDEEIITTPLVDAAWQLYLNCRIANAIGVIQGPSGTGKSWALKAIAARHAQNQLPGIVHRIKCSKASGPSSGVRALLLELGVGGAVTSNRSVAGLAYLLKLAVREMGQRNIAALLFDDADYYEPETILGLVGLFDQLKETGSPLIMILTGVANEARWLGQVPAATTRTLHIERTSVMDYAMTAAVLRHMSKRLGKIVLSEKKDPQARSILRLIHRETGGIFRRVRFLAELVNAQADDELSQDKVEAILEQMQN